MEIFVTLHATAKKMDPGALCFQYTGIEGLGTYLSTLESILKMMGRRELLNLIRNLIASDYYWTIGQAYTEAEYKREKEQQEEWNNELGMFCPNHTPPCFSSFCFSPHVGSLNKGSGW